jgi:hypothetical protein
MPWDIEGENLNFARRFLKNSRVRDVMTPFTICSPVDPVTQTFEIRHATEKF